MRKDFPFIIIICVVVIFTIGFTLYYLWRTAHPLTLIREEIFISFDGREQTITGVYHFKNHLPMNAAVKLEYPIPSGNGTGEAIIEDVILGTPERHQYVEYNYTDQDNIRLTINIPPFGDARLVVKYRQLVTGGTLVIGIRSAGPWGPARRKGTVYLNLPEDYSIDSLLGEWETSDIPEWDYAKVLSKDHPDMQMEIKVYHNK